MRARWSVLWLSPKVLSNLFPQTRYSAVVCLWVPTMPWKRKKCWTADALCPLDPSLTPQYDSELGLGSPEALIPRDEEPREEDIPFDRDTCLQEILFAHSTYKRVFHNRPSLQVNLLCRSERLRQCEELAEGECMILPVRELAVAFPRCNVCEQLKSGERSSARRSLSAPALLDEFRWQSDPVPWSSGSASFPATGSGCERGLAQPLTPRARRDSTPLSQTKCQKTAHQPDAFCGP